MDQTTAELTEPSGVHWLSKTWNNMQINRWLLAGAMLGAQTSAGHLLAQANPDEINALRQQIQELDQKLKVLERNRELDQETAEAKHKDTPRITAGANGFTLSSADTNFVLKLRGYVQADARFYVDDRIPINDTFLMRRVRPIIEGTVWKYYDFRLMMDFASGINSSAANNGFLQDGYLNIHYWPELQFQVGKFKEPVGLERLQSGANLLFVERAYPTQLVPNRDVGAQLHGELFGGALNYAAGVFNGVADGKSGDVDASDDEKDVAGRLFAQPFRNTEIAPLRGLGLGVAGTFGNQEGSAPSFVTAGQQTFFSYRSGGTNVVADGGHWRIAPQGYYYWGPLGIFGEYVLSSQELRRDAGKAKSFFDAQNQAWQVAVSYVLTGEENSFKGITPRRSLNLRDGGGWGAWEIAARVHQLRLDEGLFPSYATSSSAKEATSYGVGLNWYLNKNVKLQLDYELTEFDGGSRKPGAVTARDEHIIFSRAQLAF
jgi:phosphate-selective porin OprO and OprP